MSWYQALRRSSTALVALSVVALGSAVHADEAESGAESSAFVEDARAFARASGEDQEDLVALALIQSEQTPYLEKVIQEYNSRYASSEMTSDGHLVIWVTGAVEPGMRKLVAGREDIVLEGGAMYTADEAAELAFEVATEISQAGGSIEVLLSGVAASTGALELVVSADSEPGKAQAIADAVLRDHAGARKSGRGETDRSRAGGNLVSVTVGESGDGLTQEGVSGGGSLFLPSASGTQCTTAFPAKRGTAAGVVTANHCPESLRWGTANVLDPASRFAAHSTGDAQWHKSNTTVDPTFRYDWSKFRPVWALPTPTVGLAVCRFGGVTGTGTGCAKVKSVGQTGTAPDGTVYGSLVFSDRDTGSTGGDSGGPWYYGNNIYGVHQGSFVLSGKRFQSFSHAGKVSQNMGLTPLLGPR